MFKKSIAAIVSAAFLVAGPGHLTVTASAQTIGRGPGKVSVTPAIGTGLNTPVPGASSFLDMPTLPQGAPRSPALSAAPSIAAPAAAKAAPAKAEGSPLDVIESRAGVAEKGAALKILFENASTVGEVPDVLGRSAASGAAAKSGLSRSSLISAKSPSTVDRARQDKGSVAGAIPDRILNGALLGLAAEAGVVVLLGGPVALPLLTAMAWAGIAAGLVSQFHNAKLAQVAGTILGGVAGALAAPGGLPVLLGLVVGLNVSRFCSSQRRPNADFMAAVAMGVAGMMIGVALPGWLGGLAAKATASKQPPPPAD